MNINADFIVWYSTYILAVMIGMVIGVGLGALARWMNKPRNYSFRKRTQ